MTIKQIYNLAIEMGIAADPRGKRGVEKWLEREKKIYKNFPQEEKEFFDKERLTNPYSDTRIHFGDPDKKIKTIVTGIDVEEAEIALIKALNKDVDLVINHHPIGVSLANLDQVMNMQADYLSTNAGIPINVAEGILKERLAKISRGVAAENHQKVVDFARFAGIPLMNLHTTCDNLVYQYVTKLIERKKPETLGDIIEVLRKIPEYHEAALKSAGPRIFGGEPQDRAGKIVVLMTGGTEGAKETYVELAKAGVGTIIDMHIKEDYLEEANKQHLHVIVAGHIASDSIGMNSFLDKLQDKGIKIIPLGGLIRVRRK